MDDIPELIEVAKKINMSLGYIYWSIMSTGLMIAYTLFKG